MTKEGEDLFYIIICFKGSGLLAGALAFVSVIRGGSLDDAAATPCFGQKRAGMIICAACISL